MQGWYGEHSINANEWSADVGREPTTYDQTKNPSQEGFFVCVLYSVLCVLSLIARNY